MVTIAAQNVVTDNNNNNNRKNVYNETCMIETRLGIEMLQNGSYQGAVNHFRQALETFNTAVSDGYYAPTADGSNDCEYYYDDDDDDDDDDEEEVDDDNDDDNNNDLIKKEQEANDDSKDEEKVLKNSSSVIYPQHEQNSNINSSEFVHRIDADPENDTINLSTASKPSTAATSVAEISAEQQVISPMATVVLIKSLGLQVFQLGIIDDYETTSSLLIYNLALSFLLLSETICCKLGSAILKQKATNLLLLSHEVLQEKIDIKLNCTNENEYEMAKTETQWMVTISSSLVHLGRLQSISIDIERLSYIESRLAILELFTNEQYQQQNQTACAAA
jgi:hypothetical protein